MHVLGHLLLALVGHLDARLVVLGPGGFILERIGADVDDFAIDDVGQPLIEGAEADFGVLAGVDVVDVAIGNARLDDEIIAGRHDLHDRIAGLDHRPDGVHFQTHHGAAYRGGDGGALDLIAERGDALLGIGDVGLGLAQLLADLFLELLDLDLLLDLVLADLRLELGDLGAILGDLALVLHDLTFQLAQALVVAQPLLEQRAVVLGLCLQRGHALLVDLDHALQAVDLLAHLAHLLVERAERPLERAATGLEQGALNGQHILDALGVAREQFIGKGQRIGALLLGEQANLGGAIDQVLGARYLELRARLGLVDHQQGIASFDRVAVFNVDLVDDPAFQVLDGLLERFDRYRAGGHHRHRQVGGGRPAAEAAEGHQQDRQAQPAIALVADR